MTDQGLGEGDNQSFWVFGYGSLIWRPGFDYITARPALLAGAHRCLCIYSHHYRGTVKQPGLAFGLKRGGSCHGMAFRVEPSLWEETLAYLRAREQITTVYKEAVRPVRFDSGERVGALTYLVDETHKQYAGRLDIEKQLGLVKTASGAGGTNIDYVVNTVQHLREMNIVDKRLEELVARLEQKLS